MVSHHALSSLAVHAAAAASASGSGAAVKAATGSTITAAAAASTASSAVVASGATPLPLTMYSYAYDQIPEKVNPFAVGRGPQSGYNLCNSTTQGADSQCQTLIMNDIDDFCLWGSPTPEGQIGDVEAAVVAYCTPKNGHGARVMPDGTITGIQWTTTSAYIQINGFLNQEGVGLMANDTGGELDPHGADLLGNPLGGLVYSTNLDGGDNKTEIQALNWNAFIGAGEFCMKLCLNSVTKPDYCQNKIDLVGCNYNMPSANTVGEFVKCDGGLQDEVGVYTVVNGTTTTTTTWAQPSPTLPPGYIMPYTPRVPASSDCVTYQSTDLFGGTASASATATGASATAKGGSAAADKTSGAVATATTKAGASAGHSVQLGGGSAAFTLAAGAAALVAGVALVL